MDAAVAALLGTGIGAVGALGAAWIQQRMQGRRELVKMAAEMATRDYDRRLEIMKGVGGTMPPIAVFLAYQVELITAIANGPLTPDTVKQLSDNAEMLRKAFAERR